MLGGLVAAGEIARQVSMARSELDALPQDAAARLTFAINVKRRRREQAGGGGGGAAAAAAASSGRAEPFFSPPTSTLQCAALAQRAVEVWSGNLLLLLHRTGASSAARRADKAAPAASSTAGAALHAGVQARAPAQPEPAPVPAQPDPAAKRESSGTVPHGPASKRQPCSACCVGQGLVARPALGSNRKLCVVCDESKSCKCATIVGDAACSNCFFFSGRFY